MNVYPGLLKMLTIAQDKAEILFYYMLLHTLCIHMLLLFGHSTIVIVLLLVLSSRSTPSAILY